MDRGDLTKLATALGGLPVLACRPGSPADNAGIRYGDIVLAVNGVKTPDWGTFIEARGKNREAMLVELFRDGETLTFELSLTSASPVDTPTLLAELIAERIVPLGTLDRGPSSKPN